MRKLLFLVFISMVGCKTEKKPPHHCFLSEQQSLDSLAITIEDSKHQIDSLRKTDYDGDLYAMNWEAALDASNLLVYGCTEKLFLTKETPVNNQLIEIYKRLAKTEDRFKNYLTILEKNKYLFTAETALSREEEFQKDVWSEWDWQYPYVHSKE